VNVTWLIYAQKNRKYTLPKTYGKSGLIRGRPYVPVTNAIFRTDFNRVRTHALFTSSNPLLRSKTSKVTHALRTSVLGKQESLPVSRNFVPQINESMKN